MTFELMQCILANSMQKKLLVIISFAAYMDCTCIAFVLQGYVVIS